MATIRYEIVEHDGGWAYKVDDVFSETFPTHDDALAAAEIAARHHELPGSTEAIEFRIPPAVGMSRSPPASIARIPGSSIRRMHGTRQNARTALSLDVLCKPSWFLPASGSRSDIFFVDIKSS